MADTRLMPARAGEMDPWTLVNVLDLTKSRVIWKRFYGCGNLEEAQTKIEKARARADRDGNIEKLGKVLPLGDVWINEGERLERDARDAEADRHPRRKVAGWAVKALVALRRALDAVVGGEAEGLPHHGLSLHDQRIPITIILSQLRHRVEAWEFLAQELARLEVPDQRL